MEAVNVARRRVFVVLGTGQVDAGLPLDATELDPESSRVVRPSEREMVGAF